MDELKERYSAFNDFELLNIVYFEHEDYEPTAIEAAKSILKERGLEHPSEEIMLKTKEYRESSPSNYDGFGENLFERGKLKKAFLLKDYLFVGKWLFWAILLGGIVNAIRGYDSITHDWLPTWVLFLIDVIFTVALFGIIPVVFFVIYSLKLTKEQRRKKNLVLLMPTYVFILYGISLIAFIALVVLPRL